MTTEEAGKLEAEDGWADVPGYTREEWKRDVAEGNTQRGYWEWVYAAIEADAEFGDTPE